MKLGELFIQLGVKGDTKELDKTLKQLDKAEKVNNKVAKAKKALGRELTENEKKWLKNKNAINEVRNGLNGFLKATAGIATAVAGSVIAFDRMANAMFNANQQLITFQRTSGISLNTLNKYASASSLVNYNASLQGTAQSLQNVANNLWDIQMGRGDISPYQELAFVGGKGINPFGKSLEQVIEEIRESIKTVDDLQATNIITRMGFSPDDLMMLRMTKGEIAEINNLFLKAGEQERLNKYALQVKKIHIEFNTLGQRLSIKLMPTFIKFIDHLAEMGKRFIELWDTSEQFRKSIGMLGVALGAFFTMLNPKLAKLTFLIAGLLLLLDDIAVYFMGGDSYFGDMMKALDKFSKKEVEQAEKDKTQSTKNIEKLKQMGVGNEQTLNNPNVVRALGGISDSDTNWRSKIFNKEFLAESFFASARRTFRRPEFGLYKKLADSIPTPTNLARRAVENLNISPQTTIYTTQPADKAMGDNINNDIQNATMQFLPQGR